MFQDAFGLAFATGETGVGCVDRRFRDGFGDSFKIQHQRLRGQFDARVIDVHIARLRRKIDADHPVKLIHTIRAVGFMLREGEP